MTIAAQDTREEKLKWLMRPANWAYTISSGSAGITGLVWYDGNADPSVLLTIAFGGLVITSGLLLWALKRVTDAAKRQI